MKKAILALFVFLLAVGLLSAETKTLKIGIITPLSGPQAPDGITQVHGFELYADYVNAHGGIVAGGQTYMIKVMGYDDKGFQPPESLKCAQKAVLEDGVQFLLTTPTTAVCDTIVPFLLKHNTLLMTWGAGPCLRPDWPNVVATFTHWPQYHVTVFQEVKKLWPTVKRVAYTAMDASWAADDILWTKIACKSLGFDMVYSKPYPADIIDWNPVISAMVATKPDLIDFSVIPKTILPTLLEEARALGYTGKFYATEFDVNLLLQKVPADYINGNCINLAYEFDDPAVVGQLAYTLRQQYESKWPGEWKNDATVAWYAIPPLLKGIQLGRQC